MRVHFTPLLNEGHATFRDFDRDTAVLLAAGNYTVDLNVDTIEEALERIYRALNIGDDAFYTAGIIDDYRRRECRSLSVGDAVLIGELGDDALQAYTVASFGWTQVPADRVLLATYGEWEGDRKARYEATLNGVRHVIERSHGDTRANLLVNDLERRMREAA